MREITLILHKNRKNLYSEVFPVFKPTVLVLSAMHVNKIHAMLSAYYCRFDQISHHSQSEFAVPLANHQKLHRW